MSQLSMFPSETCDHEEKVAIQRGRGFDLMRCEDCRALFFAIYKWDGTEWGASVPVVSVPFPDPYPEKAISALVLLSEQGWKTEQDKGGYYLQTPNEGAKVRDIAGVFSEYAETGTIAPF